MILFIRYMLCYFFSLYMLLTGLLCADTPLAGISPQAWNSAMHAYHVALNQGDVKPGIITLIDYSRPSNDKRLWVIDVAHHKILYNTYVAHGRANGRLHASHFSNKVNSHETSLGVYVTQNPYVGEHGYALRLNGLEEKFNDHAYERAIVLHSQWYVKDPLPAGFQTGRSWGCPVVSDRVVKPIINQIKGGTMLIMYYPDRNWLNNSHYLHG